MEAAGADSGVDSNEFFLEDVGVIGNNFTENMTTYVNRSNCSNDYCVSNEEYVDMILAYIHPSHSEWVLIALYFVVFLVGLVGNFLVCFAVWRNHTMRTVTNFFIVNLALADFLVGLICLPPTLISDVTETWYIGSVMCKLAKYLQGVSVCVSVLTLSCISMERWYAICRPLAFKSTPNRARLLIFFIWVISLAIVLPELVVLDIKPRFPGLTVLLTSCAPTWPANYQAAYQLFLSVCLFVLPFILMFIAYIDIARCLWSQTIPTETSRDPLQPRDTMMSTAAENQLQSRRKVAKMLIAVVVMFGVCYLPVHLLNILRYSGALKGYDNKASYFALVAHWLCYFNSAINPVIYNFMSTKFRKEFRNACSCCTRAWKPGSSNTNTRERAFTYKYSQTGFTRARTDGDIHTRMATLKV